MTKILSHVITIIIIGISIQFISIKILNILLLNQFYLSIIYVILNILIFKKLVKKNNSNILENKIGIMNEITNEIFQNISQEIILYIVMYNILIISINYDINQNTNNETKYFTNSSEFCINDIGSYNNSSGNIVPQPPGYNKIIKSGNEILYNQEVKKYLILLEDYTEYNIIYKVDITKGKIKDVKLIEGYSNQEFPRLNNIIKNIIKTWNYMEEMNGKLQIKIDMKNLNIEINNKLDKINRNINAIECVKSKDFKSVKYTYQNWSE